jgi:hypothetical protein
MKRLFGRGWAEDARDRKYLIKAVATSRWSRTWELGPQTDQGSTPHCVGHAWAGWLSSSPVRQRPILPSGIYRLAQFVDEWQGEGYEGTSVRAAAKILSMTGHISGYQWAFKLEDAIPHVMEVGPIVLGIGWYAGMMDADGEGFIRPTGRQVGGHAVLCYGMDLRSGYARVRNSWGSSWGINGNCKIDLDDLAVLVANDGECCTASEARASG